MAMDDNAGAGFRFYSLGIVSVDKVEGDEFIEVVPIEDMTLALGEMKPDSKSYKSTNQNTKGVGKTSEVAGGETVKAKWVPLADPNRDNAPDVYRNETVMIYKYADTQDYYWSTIFREPRLRGKERRRISLSNLDQDVKGKGYDSDSSYWVEMDTKYKKIKLHTSDNDGEPTTYDLTIDTKEGTVELTDALGNSILLESVPGKLTVTTDYSVTVNTKHYTVNASESITLNTKTYALNTDTSEVQASQSTLEETPTSTIKGDNHNVRSQLNGTKGFALDTSEGGASTTAVVRGNIEVDGSIHATGSIIDDGGNTPHHSH